MNAILPKSQSLWRADQFPKNVIWKFRNVFIVTLAIHFKWSFQTHFLFLSKNQDEIFQLVWNKTVICNNFMLTTSFPRNNLSIGRVGRLLLQILTKPTVFSVGTSVRIKIHFDNLEGYWSWLPCLDYTCFHLSTFLEKDWICSKIMIKDITEFLCRI